MNTVSCTWKCVYNVKEADSASGYISTLKLRPIFHSLLIAYFCLIFLNCKGRILYWNSMIVGQSPKP